MSDPAAERQFQNDIIQALLNKGWLLGKAEHYHRELALYPEDLIGFIKDTQNTQWQKFSAIYPQDTEQKFLALVGK